MVRARKRVRTRHDNRLADGHSVVPPGYFSTCRPAKGRTPVARSGETASAGSRETSGTEKAAGGARG